MVTSKPVSRLRSNATGTAKKDAWSGLTDPAERRKRQNRLNQRAYRQRKRQQESTVTPRTSPSPDAHDQADEDADADAESEDTIISTPVPTRHKRPQHCPGLQIFAQLDRFTETAYTAYMLGNPTADHLLTLSKVNVFRAFGMILGLMGMNPGTYWMHDDAISPFNTAWPGVTEDNSLPPVLRPTKLQKTKSHHPWLDFFPLPKMRDNLIHAGDDFDDGQLCVDIMGFWDMSSNGHGDTDHNGMLLVWGEPTDPSNWEVTEGFLRKWPWVVRGCPELLQSTNNWRRQRGDMMLFRYV